MKEHYMPYSAISTADREASYEALKKWCSHEEFERLMTRKKIPDPVLREWGRHVHKYE